MDGNFPEGLLIAFDFAPGGWMRVNFPEARAPAVLVKTVERGGRRVVTRLIVAADPVDAAAVKAVPTGRLESLANVPWVAERLAKTDEEADPLAALDPLLVDLPVARVERQPRPQLRRPDGSDPAGFYAEVAAAYNEAVAGTSAPATVLAAEAGVPVPTARRWVAEARRRGLLPPGRKGRAG